MMILDRLYEYGMLGRRIGIYKASQAKDLNDLISDLDLHSHLLVREGPTKGADVRAPYGVGGNYCELIIRSGASADLSDFHRRINAEIPAPDTTTENWRSQD